MSLALPGFEECAAKGADIVLTPDDVAADVVRHFRPTGPAGCWARYGSPDDTGRLSSGAVRARQGLRVQNRVQRRQRAGGVLPRFGRVFLGRHKWRCSCKANAVGDSVSSGAQRVLVNEKAEGFGMKRSGMAKTILRFRRRCHSVYGWRTACSLATGSGRERGLTAGHSTGSWWTDA